MFIPAMHSCVAYWGTEFETVCNFINFSIREYRFSFVSMEKSFVSLFFTLNHTFMIDLFCLRIVAQAVVALYGNLVEIFVRNTPPKKILSRYIFLVVQLHPLQKEKKGAW